MEIIANTEDSITIKLDSDNEMTISTHTSVGDIQLRFTILNKLQPQIIVYPIIRNIIEIEILNK